MSAEEQARIHNEILAQSEDVEELFWDPTPRDDVPFALRKWVSDNVEEALKKYIEDYVTIIGIEDGRIYLSSGSGWDDLEDGPNIDLQSEILDELAANPDEYEDYAQALESIATEVRAIALSRKS